MSVLTLNLFRKDESTSLCVAVGPSFLLLYNIPRCSYTAVDLYALFIGLWGIFFYQTSTASVTFWVYRYGGTKTQKMGKGKYLAHKVNGFLGQNSVIWKLA